MTTRLAPVLGGGRLAPPAHPVKAPNVPALGYLGAATQTAATRATMQTYQRPASGGGMFAVARKRKRRKAAAAPARRRAPRKRRAATRRSKKLRRFVKGSAEAKRYMAKLRRMRRK